VRKLIGFLDASTAAMIVFGLMICWFAIGRVHASGPVRRDVRTVRLSNLSVVALRIAPGRSTIVSFPTKPAKVILGNSALFAVEYVENDLAISSIARGQVSNLFVYLEGRRFAFDLVPVPWNSADSIVVVRDQEEPEPTRKKR
jgi:hypothetical protein